MRIVIFVLFTIASLGASEADRIRLRGSDTLGAKLVPMLCELYREKNPHITFDIAAEGSTSAFAALLDGTADIGMSLREARPEEVERFAQKGIRLVRHLAANDCFVIVVNMSNSLDALTRKQVAEIFTGDVANWSAVGGRNAPISIYTRNKSSGAFSEFRRLAMSGRDYANSAISSRGSDSPSVQIGNDKLGITYVSLSYANQPGIKAMRIDGCVPTDPEYPYHRPSFYLMHSDARKSVRDFLAWAIHSDEALAVIAKVGFLPPQK